MIYTAFLSGMAMAMFMAAGVFFLKFWWSSRDRFFLLFTAACGALAAERVALLLVPEAESSVRTSLVELSSWVYVFRLVAFGLILIAIIDKNRTAPSR